MSVKDKLEATLTRVADSLGITNYDLTLDETALRGEGFLSEFYTGSVRNKDTGEVTEAYIKYPPQGNTSMKENVFRNEQRYYSTIYPELQKFQKEKNVKIPFDKIPKYYCGDGEPDKANIVLENLKLQGYVLWDKTKFINEEHLIAIFKTYGKYHALTFAFKDQNQERCREIVEGVSDIFLSMFKEETVISALQKLLEVSHDIIKKIDEKKAKKLVPLIEDTKAFCLKGIVYEGKYSAITHGDCWSNNMMFKYDKNGKIEDLRLVDHQLVRDSTPVHDLSYFFYAGASNDDFKKLNHFLEIYYESFCSFARELGSDPDKILPFEALKADWKECSLLGIKMSLFVWQAKLMTKEQVAGVSSEKEMDNIKDSFHKITESDEFKKLSTDILLHAIDYGII